MNIVLLGVGIGLLTLVPPGPISLALVQVGTRHGRQPALRGALGVASGDMVLGVAAVLIVGMGAALPARFFSASQIGAALLLVAIGLAMLIRPDAASSSIDRIQRPGRAMFLLTSVTPTALGAWIALLAAMPFATEPAQLALFAIGVVVASFVWHPMLGLGAARVGSRLTPHGQKRLSQAGGVAMAAVGAALLAT